jgi:hypothetical protein
VRIVCLAVGLLKACFEVGTNVKKEQEVNVSNVVFIFIFASSSEMHIAMQPDL